MSGCRLCAASLADAARLVIAPAPSGAQDFEPTADAARARSITLEIAACSHCGLVQSVSAPVAYHRRAITAAGVSPTMRAHRREQADRLAGLLAGRGRRLALVGCGNGYELPILAESGFAPTGIESGGAPAGYAGECPIRAGYPARDAPIPGGPYDGVACYNFLEHAPDPVGFLAGIGASLVAGAAGVIEVPDYERQRSAGRVADYVADHLSYFTTATLRATIVAAGYEVTSIRHVRGGENLEAMVRWPGDGAARDLPRPDAAARAAVFAGEAERLARAREAVRDFFAGWNAALRPALAWGASHQALTLLAGIRPADGPAAILDSAGFKAGRFAPASGLPVVAPAAAALNGAGAVLVMAAGYEVEIERALREQLGFAGEVWTITGDALRRLS